MDPFACGFAPLHGDRPLQRHFPRRQRRLLSGAFATPATILSALKGKHYWHFSSHGSFSWDDPGASGLLLADKKPLTVADLIRTEGLRAPRLVVLSACETGLYDIAATRNEFIGLPTAFLQLGGQGVLATLWPVEDLSAALLVAKFYDLHRGKDLLAPAAALREAQKWLREGRGQDFRPMRVPPPRTAASRKRSCRRLKRRSTSRRRRRSPALTIGAASR